MEKSSAEEVEVVGWCGGGEGKASGEEGEGLHVASFGQILCLCWASSILYRTQKSARWMDPEQSRIQVL